VGSQLEFIVIYASFKSYFPINYKRSPLEFN